METLHAAVTVTGEHKKEHYNSTHANESNYVDLGSTSTVKVTFTGDRNQRALFRRKENWEEHEKGQRENWKDVLYKKDNLNTNIFREPEETSSDLMNLKSKCCFETEEPDYTDMYLNSRCESESDDGERSISETITTEEAESHYITTHEIQLTELDHDVDHELGRTASSCWDYEDDNLVYSFVDYASFKSDKTTDRRSRQPPKPAISTESECYESDEGGCNATGHIHVSIKSSSRTVNSLRPPSIKNDVVPQYSSIQEKNKAPYDMQTHCFIPAPGRQHLASKLKGKDVTEFSSGASSSISELDDADKEVQNLTAKSFRSLACPYFDTIDLRPSSESSVSEQGLSLNRWSAFVDLNYQNFIMQGERKNSTCSEEMRKYSQCENKNVAEAGTVQTSVATSKYRSTHLSTNVTCGAKTEFLTARERRAICIQNETKNAVTSCEPNNQQSGAIFASSLLKNVISKKMRFEQECKMERGELKTINRSLSPHQETRNDKDLPRQNSETESGHSIGSVEEFVDTLNEEPEMEPNIQSDSTPTSEMKADEPFGGEAIMADKCETMTIETSKKNEDTFESDNFPVTLSDCTEEKKECVSSPNGKMTKMSNLYIPGSHFFHNYKETAEDPSDKTAIDPVLRQTSILDASSKPPEIKISLHNVKDNKSDRPFNIASLLTPNLAKHGTEAKPHLNEKVPHFTVRDVRDSRCKLQTPIHQVRDVRKLVKSSYRFVPVESGDNKNEPFTLREETDIFKKEPDKNDTNSNKNVPTPMVIKCQSVNTNSVAKHNNSENDRSSPKSAVKPSAGEPQESQIKTRWKSEKLTEAGEKRAEGKIVNQVALEKLKAAVKTMEQLYVFDRNEWRRKTEAPRPVTGSHVLSLISSEEQKVDNEKLAVTSECPVFQKTSKTSGSDTTCKITNNTQDVPKIQQVSNVQTDNIPEASSVKIYFPKSKIQSTEENNLIGLTPDMYTESQNPVVADSENYLTIPIKPCPLETNPHIPEPSPTLQIQSQPRPPLQRSPIVTESWSPESPTLTLGQHPVPTAQIVCVSPPMDQQASSTQRKLLLDPITGQCYLVDTPIVHQPVTQRLFYPEGVRYMDVPIPVALSPATYLICPPAFVAPHSPSVSSEGESGSTAMGPTEPMGGSTPVISITSQPGPRIVAPPSFDGTTMSFVVEHR